MNTVTVDTSEEAHLHGRPSRNAPQAKDYVAASTCCTGVVTAFLVLTPAVWHWFVIPVWASGCLIFVDAAHWWRTRDHLARARHFASLLGTFMLFLAPLLHVALGNWMTFVVPPRDWRPWLGQMATLNILGLVGYRVITYFGFKSRRTPTTRWSIRPELLIPSLYAGLAIAAIGQAYFYLQYGGIVSFAATVPGSDKEDFVGSAWQFAIAESFPYLLLVLIGVRYRRDRSRNGWSRLCLLLAVFTVVALIFGGLRGSRANVVWPTLAVLAMIDLNVRRIPRLVVPVLIAFLVVFSFVYGFFKSEGLDGLLGAADAQRRSQLEATYNRALDDIVLSDLGRSDVQAFLLYRIYGSGTPYHFGNGATYAGALALPVPPSLWADRPETKLKYGTEAQYGPGRMGPGDRPSSRVYGLQGEALLNFGFVGVPLSLWLFGALIARVDAVIERWRSNKDARMLLAPLLLVGTLQLFIQDSDILVFFIAKTAALPVLLLFFTCARRIALPSQGVSR